MFCNKHQQFSHWEFLQVKFPNEPSSHSYTDPCSSFNVFLFILLKNKHLQTEETDRYMKDHFNLLPQSVQIYEVWYKLEHA